MMGGTIKAWQYEGHLRGMSVLILDLYLIKLDASPSAVQSIKPTSNECIGTKVEVTLPTRTCCMPFDRHAVYA